MTNKEFLKNFKSIEFWLTFLCTLAVVLITSGIIAPGTLLMKIALASVTLLQAYGFFSKQNMRTQNEDLSSQVQSLSQKK